jgi:putative transposase
MTAAPHLAIVPAAQEWVSTEEAMRRTGYTDRWLRAQVAAEVIISRVNPLLKSANGRPVREYLAASLPALAQPAQSHLALVTAPVPPLPLFAGFEKTESPRIVLPNPEAEKQAESRLQILRPIIEFPEDPTRFSHLVVNGKPVTSVERMIEFVANTTGNSPRTIKRWLAAFRSGSKPALADRIRTDKGQSRWFNSHHQAAVLAAYLHLNERQSITFVCEQIELNREQLGIEIGDLPSRETVRIFLAQQISPAMKALAREGQREYRERMAPYLRRMYTDIFSNQVWVGDTAILDVECQNDVFPELPDFAPLRLRITAFEDFRSRKFVGATFAVEGSSISISAALLRAILQHGMPEMIYVDNGKDYKKVAKGAASGFEPVSETDIRPLVDKGLLARLGIGVTHCIPRHPQSKHVERMFRTLHLRFDSVHSTYTSGSPATRPDSTELAMMHHRRLLKKGRADLSRHPYASRIINGCLAWIEEYNATPHSGEGMEGMSPNEVFAACLNPEQRPMPDQAQLAILMAEYKECTVDSCAVRLNRRRYVPSNDDRAAWGAMHEMNERRILVAFNPTDPEFAVALDLDGHYIAWLVQEQLVRFSPNDPAVQQQIGESMEIRRGLEKATRQTLKVIEATARANGAQSAEEMLYERLQLPANAGTAITHRKPRLAPTKKAEAPMTPAQVARMLLED